MNSNVACRFSYWNVARRNNPFGWIIPIGLASFQASLADGKALAAEWTRRDKGKRLWRCEECLLGSFDYPK